MKVIKFNAIWCSACLVMKKTYQKIFEEYSNFEIISYDYDIDCEQVEKYNIGTTIPVLIFLDNQDNEITRIVGEKTYQQIKDIIEEKVLNNYEV